MTPIAAHPKYLDAKQCVDTLNAALAKIDVRLVEIARDMPAPSADRDAAQIEAALTFAATGEVRAPANASRSLTDESQMLSEQRAALVKEIGVRTARLDFVVGSLSVEIRAELAPAHKKLAALMADHLQSVADVIAEEVAMFGDQGIECALVVCRPVPCALLCQQVTRSAAAVLHARAKLLGGFHGVVLSDVVHFQPA